MGRILKLLTSALERFQGGSVYGTSIRTVFTCEESQGNPIPPPAVQKGFQQTRISCSRYQHLPPGASCKLQALASPT
jgi:hypothetical protein